jgi:ankyrin repeat protein
LLYPSPNAPRPLPYSNGRSGIHWAALGSSADILELFLCIAATAPDALGASPAWSVEDIDGCSPLYLCARHGFKEGMVLLLAALTVHRSGGEPAGMHGERQVARGVSLAAHPRAMKEHGREAWGVDRRDSAPGWGGGASKALDCVREERRRRVMRDVVRWPSQSSGRSILHAAAEGGHAALVDELLSTYDADSLQKDKAGRTPLHLALRSGVVQALLRAPRALSAGGRDDGRRERAGGAAAGWELLGAEDKDGRTALHLAVLDGRDEVARALVEGFKGLSAQRNAAHGEAGLVGIGSSRAPESKRELLDAYDAHNETPLMMAVQRGSDDLVRLLLAAGANPARGGGASALATAMRKGLSAHQLFSECAAPVGAAALADAGASHRRITAYERQGADLAAAAAPDECLPGRLVYDRCQHLPFSLPPNRLRAGAPSPAPAPLRTRDAGGGRGDRSSGIGEGRDRAGRESGSAAGVFGRVSDTTYIGPCYAHFGNALMLEACARPGGKAKHRARGSGFGQV